MQAILTKILPATNTKPTRIMASCGRGSLIASHPDALGGDEAHIDVATRLVTKFIDEDHESYGTPKAANPWGKPFVTGTLPNGDTCHVFLK